MTQTATPAGQPTAQDSALLPEIDYQPRLDALCSKLRRRKLQAMLVSNPENRRYLCGYRGGDHGISESSGLLLVTTGGELILITDFRFELQARQEAPQAEVLIHKTGALPLLAEKLAELGISSIGFESHYTLHEVALKLSETLEAKGITVTPLKNLIEDQRVIKDEAEIARLRDSVRLNEEVFLAVYNRIADFNTEIELALAIENEMRLRGAEGPSFATIVASGVNGALPHAVPSNVPLQQDGSLTIDMGLIYEGYCSDMTRTFVPGHADDKYQEIHRIVRRAQLAGLEAIRAGALCCDVDRAARRIIEDAGYGEYFGHSLGHGVGLAIHEEPRLSFRSRQKLQPGMIVTVEPGIYLPGWGGIRLENMVVVREDGYEMLNQDTTWLDI